MRIITCASYYGTGSSAIVDLLGEYDDFKYLGNYEFRFIQDPDGISDLEYNIVENNHRHNSGNSLKRYKRNVDFLAGGKFINKYESYFNNKWKEYSYKYIDDLTDFTYKGYWHQDVIEKGKIFYTYKRIINKILKRTIWRRESERSFNELPKEITICSNPSEEKFLEITRKYIYKLFSEANDTNKNNIIVDQLVPASNLKRYLRYFNDIKVFIVDRDPRDIYLLEKYIWKGNVIPTESVEKFCKWFLYTRNHRNNDVFQADKVFFLQFEDLIYNYKSKIIEIQNWLEVSSDTHIFKKKKFNPEKSILNTRLWEKGYGNKNEIEYIEKHLSKYIYNYSGV